jgi:hypothetical protein
VVTESLQNQVLILINHPRASVIMLRKLALLLFAIHSVAIAIPKISSPDSVQTAIPTPEKAASFASPAHQLLTKRYYYPETLPDEDELEVLLREKSMREAGFVSTSSASFAPEKPQLSQKQKLHKPLPDSDAPIPVPTHPNNAYLDSESGEGQSSKIKYRWEHVPVLWPPFGFFVVASVVVCFFTILRGVRSKT